jgi:hypothetical protein
MAPSQSLILLSALVATSCVTATPPLPADPLKAYVGEVQSSLQLAAEETTVMIRYNPVSCNCPPFEIQLGARWVRLEVRGTREEGSSAAAFLAQARADLETGHFKSYTVSGELATNTGICGQGTIHATFSLESSE